MEISIVTPSRYIGAIMELVTGRRGIYQQDGLPGRGAASLLTYEMPLGELIVDFYDQLKSRTQGYASLDYQLRGVPAGRSGQARRAGQRRAGRCAVA